MSRAERRGFTLLEAIVASGLGFLLLTLTAQFLVPGMRISAQGTAVAEMQQQGLLALQRLADELNRSVGAGSGLLPPDPIDPLAPVAVGIVPLQSVSADGLQVWSEKLRVFYWDRRTKKLYRKEYPPAPPLGVPLGLSAGVPQRPSALALRQICDETNGTEAVIAFGVDGFEIGSGGLGVSVASPITLTIQLSREVPGKKERLTFSHTRVVALRNSL